MQTIQTTLPSSHSEAWSREQGPRRIVDAWLLRYYDELCQLASTLVRKKNPRLGRSAAIELVHEAYLRLRDQEPVRWLNHRHFISWTWRVMCWIVSDQERQQRCYKRGGSFQRVVWDDVSNIGASENDWSTELAEALDLLKGAYPRRAAVVERRVFEGYTLVDTAQQMGISLRTAERDWQQSKRYLRRVLEADSEAA